MPSSQIDLEEFSEKLDTLIALMAAQVGSDLPLSERAPLLARLGLDRTQIARVCGTSPGTVSVRLAEAKRRLAPKALVPRRAQDEQREG